MGTLTKAEERIMQILWDLERGFIKDIQEHFPDPKPPYNTISTIVGRLGIGELLLDILDKSSFEVPQYLHNPFFRFGQGYHLITFLRYYESNI